MDALILPGSGYSSDGPLLNYARMAATRRGASVSAVTWSGVDAMQRLSTDELEHQICEQVRPHLDALASPRPVLIGKSLGVRAAALAAERDLPAIWLTPVLCYPDGLAALRRASAPFLLVGGTADHLWDSDVAFALSEHVLEIDGADHNMLVPGPMAESAVVLGRVVTAIEEFLDNVVWPT